MSPVPPSQPRLTIIQAQQKLRDEQVLRQASQGLALVKDTIRAGYDSRITSGEFQDVQNNQDLPVNRGAVFHHRDLSDVAEVPIQTSAREITLPIGGRLHPQPKSAPHTPYGLPSPLLDPNIRGPLTGNSLPVEGTSSTFIGHGNTTHEVFVTATGQTIVSPFPVSSAAIPGSDHLLGATAHYESRETQVQLPTVVDSSVIREVDNLETFPIAETRPPSAAPQVAQSHYQYPQSPYPYGPHGNLAPFNSFPPQDPTGFNSNLAQDPSRHQGPSRGGYGSQRGRGRSHFNDSFFNKRNNGQRDGQDRNNASWNGSRAKGSTNNNNNNSSRGSGGRGSHQNFRGQIGRSNGQSRNHASAGPDHPLMENSNPPLQGLLPHAGSALPPRPNAQYPPMIQPHMHPMGYQVMMPPGQSYPPAYGYSNQHLYPPFDQDWTSIPGVNTDLMTESEIISLSRQRWGESNVQTSIPKVTSSKLQPSSSTLITPSEAVKPAIEGQISVPGGNKKSNDQMQVRDVQTALDVTVTDPFLAADTKDGSNKAPVTKFPDTLSFGTAPHITPMNLREPDNGPASVAVSVKRKATRRANQDKVKAEAEEDRAAKEEARAKQASNRAARAQRRESKIFGENA
jgi:hypothetical protein